MSKEEIAEKRILAASIRFYEKEQHNVKKYQAFSIVSVLIAVAIGAFIYIDSGACFKNYKQGIFLSFFAGLALMWGYYTFTQMHMHRHLTSYIDKSAMNARIEELGGLESAPSNTTNVAKNALIWFLIAFVLTLAFKYVQQP